MYRKGLTKEFLEDLYQKYNHKNSVDDPIWNVLIQKDPADQEILAFISATYAFGNIKQINNSISKIFELLEPSAYQRISDLGYINFIEQQNNISHRFLFHNDLVGFLKTINRVIVEFGSIKNLFLKNYNPNEINLKTSIINFTSHLRKIHLEFSISSTRKVNFLYPTPEKGSPCKRINLFLRWMVRKDNVDLGLWREIKKSQLIIPLDTHIFQIAKHFKLTKLKRPSWKMAVEITANLKKFDEQDPVKYDFALSHIKF